MQRRQSPTTSRPTNTQSSLFTYCETTSPVTDCHLLFWQEIEPIMERSSPWRTVSLSVGSSWGHPLLQSFFLCQCVGLQALESSCCSQTLIEMWTSLTTPSYPLKLLKQDPNSVFPAQLYIAQCKYCDKIIA